ncbi:hypothetical protein HPP92_024810 [Vanilla planifolia]|uniref:Uncharacterized protein n=1 Tax=Vanilla planifolia TaxID=51239 RepID=A0A835UBQ6_VANPL|nr:hypothetical protein HPP92_024810 [Vanilla planifolia]
MLIDRPPRHPDEAKTKKNNDTGHIARILVRAKQRTSRNEEPSDVATRGSQAGEYWTSQFSSASTSSSLAGDHYLDATQASQANPTKRLELVLQRRRRYRYSGERLKSFANCMTVGL